MSVREEIGEILKSHAYGGCSWSMDTGFPITTENYIDAIFIVIKKELRKKKKDERKGNGVDCKCYAAADCLCCCNVDWNDYKLYNKAIDNVVKGLGEPK